MSFEIRHKTSSLLRATFMIDGLFDKVAKPTVDRSYLEKVEEYNMHSRRVKQRNIQSRRGSKKTILGSEEMKELMAGFDSRNISASLNSESQCQSPTKSPHNRLSNLISLSFVSQTDQCIKIRDLQQQKKQQSPVSAKLPTNKGFTSTKSQHPNSKLQEFLTNSSYSPNKSNSKQKKSIINFPKLPEFKLQESALKKTFSNQRGSVSPERINSSNKRPQSSRKYVKLAMPEQLALRIFKS